MSKVTTKKSGTFTKKFNHLEEPFMYMKEQNAEFPIVFESIAGSHAYGTNVKGSDIDIKGVFVQSAEHKILYGKIDQIKFDADTEYFELSRFLDLLVVANPTVLELLFMPERCHRFVSESFRNNLLRNEIRNRFLTKRCNASFCGYAQQQITKASGLNKKMNYENDNYFSKSKDVLDFCWVLNEHLGITESVKTVLARRRIGYRKHSDYVLSKAEHCPNTYFVYFLPGSKGMIGKDSNELRTASVPKSKQVEFVMHFNHGAYKEHARKHKEYKVWMKNRNVQRYVDVNSHGQQIDGKNMLHCIRLIETARDILKTGTLIVERPNAEYLISIRKGKLNLQEILEAAKVRIEEVETAFRKSDLPNSVSGHLIRQIKKNMYELL